jgi:large subunit ribosomal protein L18
MPLTSLHHKNILRRRLRTRSKLAEQQGTPRLSVHRSLRHITAQVIDDLTGRTLAAAHDLTVDSKMSKTERATFVGSELAKAATKAGVTAVRFDRGEYLYHGRVAALAEAARSNGLTF